jgi:DNA-binding NtrC family response regulator
VKDAKTEAAAKARLLLVEDDANQRRLLAGFLRKAGYRVDEAGSAAEAVERAAAGEVDLLITDLRLGGPDGIALLQELRRDHPDLQAIVMTAYGTVEDAVRSMRAGAYDFLPKPVVLDRLEALIAKALEKVGLSRENRALRTAVRAADAFADLVGNGPAVRQVKDVTMKVAPTRASVLILGESGTGKEVVARAIHRLSARRDGPFVTLNCAVLSETLVESELFGHERGAFTGAAVQRKGRFELAKGGTLFLDEVGDIPPAVQVKLLNVLQTGRFERVGGTQVLESDARVIAATHRDLETRIATGEFRADLFYRLNVVTLRMPPLRERPEDLPALVDHFLRKHADLSATGIAGISPAALDLLAQQAFPGNVRELENQIEHALVMAAGPVLEAGDFPVTVAVIGPGGSEAPPGGGLEAQVARLERDLILRALERNGGNRSAAARELGLGERAVRYKMQKLGLS